VCSFKAASNNSAADVNAKVSMGCELLEFSELKRELGKIFENQGEPVPGMKSS
jgi:hypothetical protein